MEKSELIQLLHNSVVDIEFVKKDGTNRKMKATLKPEYLPSVETSGRVARAKSDEVLSVWDTEAEGWRSFIFSSLTNINGVSV